MKIQYTFDEEEIKEALASYIEYTFGENGLDFEIRINVNDASSVLAIAELDTSKQEN